MEIKILIYLSIVALVLFIIGKIMSKFKAPKIGCMALVTGGVKTGKSTMAVYLAISKYKSQKRRVKVINYFRRLVHKSELEEPLLYSNIPLAVPYSPLTEDLLQRKTRFRYGSVIYVCEASLLADSQLIKDMDLNQRLLLFNKLIGHETKGGYIIYDTQTIADCHYSIKRCLSEYFYIHHLEKRIPFFLIAYVREDRYSEDGSVVNVSNSDVEDTLKRVLIPKSTWKKFDCYCYSKMTDNLPVSQKIVKTDDLKIDNYVTFRRK